MSVFLALHSTQPSENSELSLLLDEISPANCSTPYHFLLPVAIYVLLLTQFLNLSDT